MPSRPLIPIPTRKGRLHPGTALLLCPQAGAIQGNNNTEGGRDDNGNIGNWQSDDGRNVRPRRSLEELVDRLIAALFSEEPETEQATETPSVAKSLHEARRLRQAGDVDGALAVLAGMDTAKAETREARWAYAEWTDLVKRRFGDRDALVYSQGTGQAAALVPPETGTLEVAAVLGMRWRPGKVVSGRSLRGLRPLAKACPRL